MKEVMQAKAQASKKTNLLKQVSKIAKEEEVTPQDIRKLSFFMGDDEVVKDLVMYYCTELGKVKG